MKKPASKRSVRAGGHSQSDRHHSRGRPHLHGQYGRGAGMTLDKDSQLAKFETFERVLGARMERIFTQSMLGEVYLGP